MKSTIENHNKELKSINEINAKDLETQNKFWQLEVEKKQSEINELQQKLEFEANNSDQKTKAANKEK